MLFHFPGSPPPPPAVPTGPGAQLTLLLLFGVLLIAFVTLAYFFFELCHAPRSEEFWRNVEQLQARRKGKKWWKL